jgi:hypothetical protein
MTRATEKGLEYTLNQINTALGRPTKQFASKIGEPVVFSVGHFALSKDSSGWSLEEQSSVNGSVSVKASGMTTGEMSMFLRAFIQGIMTQKCNIPGLYSQACANEQMAVN